MAIKRVALLTAGGFAPCLSTAVAYLIRRYSELLPEAEIIAYKHGYHGLLSGDYITVDDDVRDNALVLTRFGGSPIGNSRVKLTNTKDLVERGLVEEGQNPLEVAAEKLREDGVDVLHTIGGDDTNTTAADLAQYLENNGYHLTVVGLPKTIDNDVIPIQQSLGAYTAAEEAARFATHVIGEHNANPRELIVHEVMGRNCGWLTAYAAKEYRAWLDTQQWVPSIGLKREQWDIHAVFVPELHSDLDAEAKRLKKVMDEVGNVNIFLSEGAGVDEIVEQMEAAGEEVPRDPFGHVKLDLINPGKWFAKQFAHRLEAEKVMVQKSGYFSRSAASNQRDLHLIQGMTDYAVACAVHGDSGVIGHDEEDGGKLACIDFSRIKGGKPFDINQQWFIDMLDDIGQAHS